MAIAERHSGQDNDLELVRRLASGDEAAAREFYNSYCDALYRFVKRRCGGSEEDTEEIAMDTFLAALDLASSFRGECSVFTWLCSLSRNRIADFHRRTGAAKRIPEESIVRLDDASRARIRTIHDPSVSVEQLVEQLDRLRIVQALLATLTPDQREAVTMRYVEGFSVPEIAKIMGRSPDAVERLLERAKQKPRKEMVNWLGDHSFRALCFDLLSL